MKLGLVRLAWLRALRPWTLVAAVLLLALALRGQELGPAARLELAGDAQALALAEHGFVRERAWTLVALLGVGWFACLAARTLPRWRRRDIDWLACRATGPAALVLPTWLGLVAAGSALALAAAAALELTLGGGGASWRAGPAPFDQEGGWLAPGFERALPLTPATVGLPAGTRLRLVGAWSSAAAAREAPTRAESTILARVIDREGGRELARSLQRLDEQGRFEVELPRWEKALELRLALAHPDARVYVDARAAETWIPAGSERGASLVLLAHTLLALAAWSALGLGLGGWLGAGLACACVLALLAVASATPELFGNLPLARLGRALAQVQEGRLPAAPARAELAGGALLGIVGLALAMASLVRWRREPR